MSRPLFPSRKAAGNMPVSARSWAHTVPHSVPLQSLAMVPHLVPPPVPARSQYSDTNNVSVRALFRFLFRLIGLGSGRNCVLLEATQFRSHSLATLRLDRECASGVALGHFIPAPSFQSSPRYVFSRTAPLLEEERYAGDPASVPYLANPFIPHRTAARP